MMAGDWPWLRPAFIFPGDSDVQAYQWGAIDIFNATGFASADEFRAGASPWRFGMPHNYNVYGNEPPQVVITQQERYYPQAYIDPTGSGAVDPPKPQYVWDCAFRRYGGRIMVAVFVYRVSRGGGERSGFIMQPNQNDDTVPPMPIWLNLSDSSNSDVVVGGRWTARGPDDNFATEIDNAVVLGADPSILDLNNDRQAWMTPNQWLIDQNNNVHRVMSNYRDTEYPDAMLVELQAPIPVYSTYIPIYHFPEQTSDIWYVPNRMAIESYGEYVLTPVYATVQEL